METMMITDEELDELDRLADCASRGEWGVYEEPRPDLSDMAYISCKDEECDLVECVCAWREHEQEMHDFRFIVAANPITIRKLTAEIRRLHEAN